MLCVYVNVCYVFLMCSFVFYTFVDCIGRFVVMFIRLTFEPCTMCATAGLRRMPWLRTNGVNTNGAAAKVLNQLIIAFLRRIGEKGTPLALLGRYK